MEDGNPPLPPPPPPIQDSRSIHIMANLKDSLLTHLAKSNPSLSINIDDASSFIQQRLPQLFHSFHTPTHPPYALMIENALKGLNEENGSTEEAISEFIKREYQDLPWAHVKILGVQLKMLCENDELVRNENGRYVFVGDGVDGKGTESKGGEKKKKKKKGKKRNNRGKRGKKGGTERCVSVERDNELQDEGIDEQIRASGLRDARTDEPSRMVVECVQEQLEEEENPNEGSKKKKGKKRNNLEKRGKKGRMERCESVERDNELQEEGIDEQIQVLRDGRTDEPSRMAVECIHEQLEEENDNDGRKKRKKGKKRNNRGKMGRKGRMERCESVERDNELQEERIEEQIPASELHDTRTDEPSKMVVECVQEQLVEAENPNELLGEGTKEKIEASELHDSRTDQPSRMLVECIQEQVEEGENPLIERVEEQAEAEKGPFEVVGKQSQSEGQETRVIEYHVETEAPAQNDVEKSQIQQDSVLHLETICPSQQTALNLLVDSQQPSLVPISEGLPKFIPSAGIQLSITQLQQQMPCNVSSESSLGAPVKMSASLSSLDVREHKQDENPLSGNPEQQIPKRKFRGRPRKSEPVANYQGESLLPSGDVIVTAQKPNINKIGKRRLSQPDEHSIGRGRHWKLRKKDQQLKEQIQPHDQPQCVASFPYSDQNETINSSQGAAPNFPVNLTHKIEKQYQDGGGSIRCRGRPRKLNQNAKQHEKLSQKDQAQLHSRPRGQGRPPKVNPFAKQGETKLQKQDQTQVHGQPKRRGRPPKANQIANQCDEQLQQEDQAQLEGQPKRRGRPPKANQMANQCDEQLQQEDQAQLDDQPKRRGRPKANQFANQCDEQLQEEDQAQLRGQPKRRGKPPKANQIANQCDEQLQEEDQAQLDDQPKRRGRPPKANQFANLCDEQLQEEDQAQLHGQPKRRGRPPKANQIANQCEEQLQQEDQTPHQGRGKGRGRGLGRPPNLNQNANQYEENLAPQDQAQGLPQLLQTFQTISLENAIDSLSHFSDANKTLRQLRSQPLQVEGPQQDQGSVQNQDVGQERPPNPMLDANQSHQLLLPPQACKDQVKRRGRPPKPKQG